MSSLIPSVWCWRRRVAADQQPDWQQQLAWAGPERIIWIESPRHRFLRLEVYPATPADRRRLQKKYGGTLQRIRAADWLKPAQPPPPRAMGPDLLIVHSLEQKRDAVRKGRYAHVLLIPTGLAFGTGEHPTTDMITRRVMTGKSLAGARMLDLGTGSGILAFTGRLAGAGDVIGMDFDLLAMKTARQNEKLNFRKPLIQWVEADLLQWKPPGRFDLVTANLFRDVLIAAAPRIWTAVGRGGRLILSGLLRAQAAEVLRVYGRLGAPNPTLLKKGKWCCVIFQRP